MSQENTIQNETKYNDSIISTEVCLDSEETGQNGKRTNEETCKLKVQIVL